MDPQGAAPAPAPAELSVGDAVSYGFEALKRYLGPLVLIAFIVAALNGAVSNVGAALDSDAIRIVGQLISLFVGALLTMGVIRITLAVTGGEAPDIAALFRTDRYWTFLGAHLLYYLVVTVGLVLLIVPGIIFAIMFGFYGYVIVQDPDVGVIDALKRSSAIAKGHWGTLFLLGLALIGLNIVGFLLCCVGLLFTVPITAVAHAYAYRTLAGEPIAPVPAKVA